MYEYTGQVLRVVDGDTIDLHIDLGFGIYHKVRVRLKNIDTPEIYRPKSNEELERGRAAKKLVEDLILGKNVTLVTYKDKKGKYGRYLADIAYADDDLSLHLLSDTLKEAGFEKRT